MQGLVWIKSIICQMYKNLTYFVVFNQVIKLHALPRCALHQNYFIFDKSKINLDLKNFFGGDIHWENGKLNHIAKCKYIYLPFSSSKLQAQRAYMCSIATCSKCFGMLECTWAISQEPLGKFFENLPEYPWPKGFNSY